MFKLFHGSNAFLLLQVNTYRLQTSTAGPYFCFSKISGAVKAGDPHWVLRSVTPSQGALSPKSIK